MPRLKLDPKERRELILNAALDFVSEAGGWNKLRLSTVAERAACNSGLVIYYFKSMNSLRHSLVKAAIKSENLSVLVQAYAAGDCDSHRIKPELKAKLSAHLTAKA